MSFMNAFHQLMNDLQGSPDAIQSLMKLFMSHPNVFQCFMNVFHHSANIFQQPIIRSCRLPDEIRTL